MYFIFSKEKFVSYIIAFSTVAILFTISLVQDKNETIQTSVNTTKDENIYNTQIDNNIKKVYNNLKK